MLPEAFTSRPAGLAWIPIESLNCVSKLFHQKSHLFALLYKSFITCQDLPWTVPPDVLRLLTQSYQNLHQKSRQSSFLGTAAQQRHARAEQQYCPLFSAQHRRLHDLIVNLSLLILFFFALIFYIPWKLFIDTVLNILVDTPAAED